MKKGASAVKRKINLGFIAPYKAMEPVIKELESGSPDLKITARTGNLETGVAYARQMEKDGADIIISRGGTAKMIRESVGLPVVDIHISGYDLLRSIMLASSHSDDKIALVGFPNITLGASSIASLLEIPLEVVTIHKAEEVEEALLGLQRKNYTRILGDVVTVDVSSQLGMNGMLIHSGRESVLESFEEARRLFKSLATSQKLLRITQALLVRQESDFVVADDEGQILLQKWTSFDEMPLSPEDMKSLRIQALRSDAATVKIVHQESGALSVRTEPLQDRDGKAVAFFFEPIKAVLQQAPTIEIGQISQIPPLIAKSPSMKKIKGMIESPANTERPVFLIGDAGTGKKSIARYLHSFHRKPGLFVAAGFSEAENLIEEIFSLPVSTLFIKVDPSLDNAVRRLSNLAEFAASRGIQLVISADSQMPGINGTEEFRESAMIQIPALENRREDIEAISHQFLAEFHQDLGTQPVKIRQEAMEEIIQSPAAKNLSSLKKYLKQLALLEKGFVIEKSTLQQLPSRKETGIQVGVLQFSANETLKEIERKLIEQVLEEEDFNQTKAAKRLGINRATLWRKLKE